MITKADKKRIIAAAKSIAEEAVNQSLDKFSDWDVVQDEPNDDYDDRPFLKYMDETDTLFAIEFRKAVDNIMTHMIMQLPQLINNRNKRQ